MEASIDTKILTLLQNPSSYEQGFKLLVQTYQERLYWQVRRMVTHHEDANDVLQNIFIKIYKSVHKFKGDAKLFTWLYRIAANESITFLNKRKKQHFISADADTASFENNLQADQYFDGNAAQIKLKYAIAQLPPKQQLVFNLRYYENLSYEDMSDILDTSIGALKSSYFHAAKKVEAYLKLVAED